jgi:anti-sigma factor RsiW
MHCDQAGEMMSARLDGRLDSTEVTLLEDHLARCGACQAEWYRLQALDSLLASAPMLHAPIRLRVQVMARLSRRERARRAIIGGTALALGTVALALLALAPVLFGLLDATGITPALISGGPKTVVQLLASLGVAGRALLVLADSFAAPLALLSLCSLAVALALNCLWIGAVRRLRAAP